VWEMFRVIIEERKRREIDPTLGILRECVAELQASRPEDAHTRERLLEMQSFFETMTSCYDEVRNVPASAIKSLGKLRGKVRRIFKVGSQGKAKG
ncbi:MAG TPA: ArsR family transcriptional regulator, partial [Terriglobia bacterium]|nr:ArsR family transcriptional regulator [Terriglobia bacterium]